MTQCFFKESKVQANINFCNKFESKSSRAKGIAFHPKRSAYRPIDLRVLHLADRSQTVDSRLPTLLYDPVMGLSHGHPDRSVRGARWTGQRHRLPQDTTVIRIWGG